MSTVVNSPLHLPVFIFRVHLESTASAGKDGMLKILVDGQHLVCYSVHFPSG